MSVVILTDATRNHWITGHRGRGSPPPRQQALRPPPPPLPGTFCNFYYFFYCHLDVIGPLLCYYTKTPCTAQGPQPRPDTWHTKTSGLASHGCLYLGAADFKRLLKIESTSINVYRYVYLGISAANRPHRNNDMK